MPDEWERDQVEVVSSTTLGEPQDSDRDKVMIVAQDTIRVCGKPSHARNARFRGDVRL